jgi:hypothetical protein
LQHEQFNVISCEFEVQRPQGVEQIRVVQNGQVDRLAGKKRLGVSRRAGGLRTLDLKGLMRGWRNRFTAQETTVGKTGREGTFPVILMRPNVERVELVVDAKSNLPLRMRRSTFGFGGWKQSLAAEMSYGSRADRSLLQISAAERRKSAGSRCDRPDA